MLVYVQWAMFLSMLPLVAYNTGYISLLSPIANLVAVPIVTLITMPLIVLGKGLQVLAWTNELSGFVWHLADFSIWCVISVLRGLQNTWPEALLYLGHFSFTHLVLLQFAVWMLLVPLVPTARVLLSVLIAALLLVGRSD